MEISLENLFVDTGLKGLNHSLPLILVLIRMWGLTRGGAYSSKLGNFRILNVKSLFLNKIIASGISMENNCSCSMDDDFTSSYTICIFSSSFS